jgi:hypothetical protein
MDAYGKTKEVTVTTLVLQTFLRMNLLDLAGDDSRLQKLEAAATDLADRCARDPSSALPILMAALQPEPAAEALGEVGTIIERHWSTYRGAFQGGSAGTLYRAVAFQALFDAAELQPSLGVAMSLLLRNFLPFLERGKIDAAVKLLLDRADQIFVAEARSSNMFAVGDMTAVTPETVKPGKFERASIAKRIDEAVGPSNRAGTPGESANPQWSNAGPAWSYDFADRLTALLADYLDIAISSAAKYDADNFKALGSSLGASIARTHALLGCSNSLLWWRQALFSESAGKPYRELEPASLVTRAALDLATLVPDAYQRSLESFLTEAILALLPSKPDLTATELAKTCASIADEVRQITGASPPAGLLLSGAVHDDGLILAGDFRLSAQQWSVWLMREVKAMVAVHSPRPVQARKVSDTVTTGLPSERVEAEGGVK